MSRIMEIKRSTAYHKRWIISALVERVYAATLPNGVKEWWTPLVEEKGDEMVLRFAGLDEYIHLKMEKLERPDLVFWRCLEHTSLPEWKGTGIEFKFSQARLNRCEINFRHYGLVTKLDCYEDCVLGWEHFLLSFTQYVKTGNGHPFGQ